MIIRNAYPLAKYHMLFLPFFMKNHPQYISNKDIIERVLNTFKHFTSNENEFGNEHMVMAYNSKGASSSINSLHFQIYFLSEFNMTYNDLYIKKENFFDEEIFLNKNYFTNKIQIKFCKKNKLCACFRIKINDDINNTNISTNNKQYFKDNMTSAKIIFKIIKILNRENIPYNIIFIQNEIFIFVRKHQNLMNNFWIGSNELIGFVLIYTKEEYESYDLNTLKDCLRYSMLSSEELNEILRKVDENL